MTAPRCSKSEQIEKLDKAVFNSGHGLIQNTATILQKVDNLEQRMDGIEITGKDTSISMHLIEIAVARIEQKLNDRKEEEDRRTLNGWQRASIVIGIGGVIVAFIAIFVS